MSLGKAVLGSLGVDLERTVNEQMHIRCGFCVKILHVVIVFGKVLGGTMGKGSKGRRKRGRLHRKRRFYDPKDGENITCVAKALTPFTPHHDPHSMCTYIYIQRFLRFADTVAPFECVYLFLGIVCACK